MKPNAWNKSTLIKCMTNVMLPEGFNIDSDNNFMISNQEFRIRVSYEIVPAGAKKIVNIWYEIENIDFPISSDIIITKQYLDRIMYSGGAAESFYVEDGVNCEDTSFVRALRSYGVQFFKDMLSTERYYAFLLGDIYRPKSKPLDGIDLDRAVIALDLAFQRKDTVMASRAKDRVDTILHSMNNESLANGIKGLKCYRGEL